MDVNADQTKQQPSHISQEKARSTVVIAVAGAGRPQSKFEVAAGRSVRVDIPQSFTVDHVALAARDAEILAEILKGHPL